MHEHYAISLRDGIQNGTCSASLIAMRDILVTLTIFGSIPFILVQPHIGVLVWSWISYMNPHRYTWGFAFDFRFALPNRNSQPWECSAPWLAEAEFKRYQNGKGQCCGRSEDQKRNRGKSHLGEWTRNHASLVRVTSKYVKEAYELSPHGAKTIVGVRNISFPPMVRDGC